MPIKTNIPNYKIDVTKTIDTERLSGFSCMVDNQGNFICIDAKGENIRRENPNTTDDDDRFFTGRIGKEMNDLGDRELIYEVDGEEVIMPMFEALLATRPLTSADGYLLLNGKGGRNTKAVLKKPFITTSTGLSFRLNVHRNNLKVVKSWEELEEYKIFFDEKEEEVRNQVSEKANKLYKMTGDNIWLANLENFVKIKIIDIELYHSNYKIPNFDIEGLPDKNKTIIIPRVYNKTMNMKEITNYFRSFVPEISAPHITSMKVLDSTYIKIKLKGTQVSYDTDSVASDGTIAIRRNKISEEAIVDIDKGVILELMTLNKFIINGKVVGEDKPTAMNPVEPLYLNRPSERDYSELEGYKSSRDKDRENVMRRRAETKFLALSDDDKDKVILGEYLKKLGKKTVLPIDTLLDRTINNYMKVSKNLTPTAEEEAERLIRAQKLKVEVDRKAKEAEAAERKRFENVIKISESNKEEIDSILKEKESLSKDIAEEDDLYDFDIS